MDLPPEIDNCIKESIDYELGLPVSVQTLESKLRASEDAQRWLRDHCAVLESRLKEKDHMIECCRAEATMNAQALKKFIEENQKLSTQCDYLLVQCNKWERECSLYDRDREALMEFGNEADQRAKEAENRVRELEEGVRRLSDELQFCKHEYDMNQVDSPSSGTTLEDNLLDAVLSTYNDRASHAHAILEAISDLDANQKIIQMWDSLRPSTRKVLSMAADMKVLEKDKEHLRKNLHTAEEEAKLLFEETKVLDEENKRLLRLYQKEKNQSSGGKQASSASAKSNKRKSSLKMSSQIEGKLDFDVESARQPLSPLRHNSPDTRMQKKQLAPQE